MQMKHCKKKPHYLYNCITYCINPTRHKELGYYYHLPPKPHQQGFLVVVGKG